MELNVSLLDQHDFIALFRPDRGPQEPPGSANMTRPPSRTRSVRLLLSCPSKHCRIFASVCFCLNSPGSVLTPPHRFNSSCTRLTSRCASAAAPSTRRKRCWVSLCHANSNGDRKAKKNKKSSSNLVNSDWLQPSHLDSADRSGRWLILFVQLVAKWQTHKNDGVPSPRWKLCLK